MAYIGQNLDRFSNVEKLDAITPATSTGAGPYNLTKGGVAFTPSSADTMVISINGVVQYGNFTVSSSTVTFSGALTGNVTASGDISSSATIKAARIDITGSNASSLGATTFDFGDVTFKSGSTGIVYRHQTGKLDFPDGFKAVFGSTDQLEIYQGASSDSFIDQINTGTLRLRNAGANVFSVSRMKSVANRNFETEGDYVSLSSITSVTGSLAVSSSTGTTTVILNNLPTSDPSNAGQLYNDSGVLKVSAG